MRQGRGQVRRSVGASRFTPKAIRPLWCKRCGALLLVEVEEGLGLCAACLWALLASRSFPRRKEAQNARPGL